MPGLRLNKECSERQPRQCGQYSAKAQEMIKFEKFNLT